MVVAAASHSLKPAPLGNIVISMLMILMKKVLAALVVAVQVPTRPHDWAVGESEATMALLQLLPRAFDYVALQPPLACCSP